MTRRNIFMALIMMIPMMNCFNERKGTTELEEMEEIVFVWKIDIMLCLLYRNGLDQICGSPYSG